MRAFPGTARYLVGLVGVETEVSPGAPPWQQETDELGLRCRYELTGISYLGLGPAALAAALAEVPMAGLTGLAATTGRPDYAPATGGSRPTVHHVAGLAPATKGCDVAYVRGRLTGPGPGSSGSSAAAIPDIGDVSTRHVVVLGAAAAAHAVARVAIRLGAARLTIVCAGRADHAPLHTALLARHSPGLVSAVGPDDIAGVLADADGLIQAMPVGTKPRPSAPVPTHLLRPQAWAADVSYRPLGEHLLRRPRGSACPEPSGSGRGVLAWQTSGAFRLAAGPGADAGRALEYLAALTGTVAGNARAEAGPGYRGQMNYPHAPAS